jgi:Rod binding domain-containing protein
MQIASESPRALETGPRPLASEAGRRSELTEAARRFEEMLSAKMLESMLSTLDEGGLFDKDDTSSRFYQGMLGESLSRELSSGEGLGIARQILEQMQALEGGDPEQGSGELLDALSLGLERARYAGPVRRPRAVEDTGAIGARPAPEQLLTMARDSAATHDLDPDWVCAVIRAESAWNPQARSPKGAMGLMQLMPGTARELEVRNPWDPRQNIDGGVRYLKQLYERFDGDKRLATAAYNAGPGAVERHGGVPPFPETRGYVNRIEHLLGGYGR